MDLQTECNATTGKNILNTSQQGGEQQPDETATNKKPIDSEQRIDRAARKLSAFTLLDLCRLTFTLDGVQILNAQDATNEQFSALVDAVADVSNVEQWYLEERRDFINGLQVFCEERNYPFPFTIAAEETTPTAPLKPVEEEPSNVITN